MSQVNNSKIEAIEILSNKSNTRIDLLDILLKINIHEDLFEQFTTGNIFVQDGAGLLEKLALTGDEQISISFNGSQSLDAMKSYTKIFDVYKILEVETITAKSMRMYRIHFMSPIASKSRQSKLRISVKGKESSIVSSIMKLNLKETKLEVEDSKKESTYIFPGWSPLQAIDYMARRSTHNGNLESNSFLFYEDKDQFNFKSVEGLLKQESIGEFHQQIPTSGRQAEGSPTTGTDFFAFKTLDTEKLFDNVDISARGGFGSRGFDVDIINKTVTLKEKTHDKMFKNVVKIDDTAKQLKETEIESTKRKVSHTYTNKEITGRFEQNATRDFVMSQLENFKLIGTVIGNSNLKVGTIAYLKLQSVHPVTRKEEDTLISGNYLITAVRHELSVGDYVCVVEFRKPTRKS